MNKILAILIVTILAALGPAPAVQAENGVAADDIILPGESATLEDFIWLKRPLVVFADSPNDPRYIQQMQYITDRLEALASRDVVVLTDTDPRAGSALRKNLRPRGFMLTLIGKDGSVYLRKPAPWSVREISRVIDKMPLRQQEIRDRLGDS
ncbi:DUF4174 domain-containing protein [Roseovarius amoyensis]|uniref:DUF4174 domain-containing protein n=1 Tax=Roseovarius amoyensis TaxID=2211448 RepID=UPI000DBE1DF4|nr:DUF4174 domain-containing protein [Roseovarius amoyensis]